jgi:hypothetical protein
MMMKEHRQLAHPFVGFSLYLASRRYVSGRRRESDAIEK